MGTGPAGCKRTGGIWTGAVSFDSRFARLRMRQFLHRDPYHLVLSRRRRRRVEGHSGSVTLALASHLEPGRAAQHGIGGSGIDPVILVQDHAGKEPRGGGDLLAGADDAALGRLAGPGP